ncbi:hypothetical protein K9L97_01710 [Candidatus Woesearchaeota archaeon]|nr:hypothetical protein [Candidatus Woesearchaeota archaeon]
MERVKDLCFLVKNLDCKATNNTPQYKKERPKDTPIFILIISKTTIVTFEWYKIVKYLKSVQ